MTKETIQVDKHSYARGNVTERHADGRASIDICGRIVTGFPIRLEINDEVTSSRNDIEHEISM